MERTGWLNVKEVGSVFGMRALLFLCTVAGRGPARLLLRVVAFYYTLVSSTARRASRAYWTNLGFAPTFARIYQHIFRFAECSLDRLFFLKRDFRPFVVNTNGREHLHALAQQKRGAILLGAHLGSFEAMRAGGDHIEAPINVVGYFGNARAVNRLLDAHSDGRGRTHLLELKPDSIDFIFRAKALLERGELLAILGDRVMSNHWAEVVFLGQKARLPTGPFILAASLKCPVYLTFGLYHPPNRYELYCEPFATQVELPRGAKAEALQRYVQSFADRLEHHCRQAPDNWFNFFDFWSESHAS